MDREALIPSYPPRCAHVLFDEQARASPDADALICLSRRVSYRETNALADIYARKLTRLGVGPERFVGVHFTSSVEAIVAVLSVLKAGGAFVPMDPGYPKDRLQYIVRDCGLSIVLTSRELAEAFPLDVADVLVVDAEARSDDDESFQPSAGVTLDNAACLLYTSGSTGQPKGVVRTHRGIVSRLEWVALASDDVCCHNMSLNVGFSQERLFLALMSGLPLAVVPDKVCGDPAAFLSALEAAAVTNVTLVPQTLRQLLEALSAPSAPRLSHLKTIAVGGSTLPHELVEDIARVLPHIELVNAYGTTESGSVIRGPVPRDGHEPVPIGHPVKGAVVHVLDADMEPVAAGMVGELCISAPCLARGYLHRPEATAERFVPDPFAAIDGARLLQTGDRGMRLPDGRIVPMGRLDRQVKIRGYRIELGEVESAVRRHRAVTDVVVVAEPVRHGDARLIAYVVTAGEEKVTASSMRAVLSQSLPEHMMPSAWVFLSRLPRSSAGKVDTSALPPPAGTRPELAVPYEPPVRPIDAAIAEIWEDVLGIHPVGAMDNFFELGGDSLLAASVSAAAADLFNIEVQPQLLFEHQTIRTFADALFSGDEGARRMEIVVRMLERVSSLSDAEVSSLLASER